MKKSFSYGEELLHKTDFPSFPKSTTGIPDMDFGMNQEQNLPAIPQLPEFKGGILPSFIPNGTLPTFQNPIIYNGFPNSTIPVLIIPTTMNTSSSMIVNASIINNNNIGGSTMFGNLQEIQPELRPSKSSSDPVKKIKTQSPPLVSPLPLNTSFNYPNPLTNNAFVPISAFTSHPISAEQPQQTLGNSWIPNHQPNILGAGIQGQAQNFSQNISNINHQQQPMYSPVQIPSKDNLPVFQPNIISSQTFNTMGSMPMMSPLNSVYPTNGIDGGQARVQYVPSVYLPPGTSNNIFLNPYANTYQQNTQNLIYGGQPINNQVPNNLILQPPPPDFEKRDLNINQMSFDGLRTCN